MLIHEEEKTATEENLVDFALQLIYKCILGILYSVYCICIMYFYMYSVNKAKCLLYV